MTFWVFDFTNPHITCVEESTIHNLSRKNLYVSLSHNGTQVNRDEWHTLIIYICV